MSTLTTARPLFRQLVAEIADKARQTLPDANGRVDKAVALVLQGDVELLPDGTARVYSQSNGVTSYHLVNGVCDCADYERAPSQWCKHRIAHGIQTRVQARLPVQGDDRTLATRSPAPETAPPVAAPALPEAPASCNVYVTIGGHKVQVTLRDSDEQRMLARLQVLLDQYPPPPAPPASSTAQGEGWCAKHALQMTQTHKDGRSWWSHKTDQGWCKGK